MIYANVYQDLDVLRTINGASIRDQQTAVVSLTNVNKGMASSLWRFAIGEIGTDDGQLVVVPTHGASFGSWLRSDSFAKVVMSYDATFPNNTVLYTVPTQFNGLAVLKTALQIDTPFTGLPTASIGINSNISLAAGGLGTVVGGLAAPIGAFRGVEGSEINTPRRSILKGGDVIRHNVLTAGYTGGTGDWILICAIF